jgi:DNA-binding transcriptional MerR regulator
MLYTTRHVCELYSISHTTVKHWAQIYAPFLSEVAKPPKGNHRAFTVADLKVFALVDSSKRQALSHEEIYAALANGQRGDLPPQHIEFSLAIEPREQIAVLQTRIRQLEAEVETLRPIRDENIELKALLKKAESELDKARDEIRRLDRAMIILEMNNHAPRH